jgi:hypothetical protein
LVSGPEAQIFAHAHIVDQHSLWESERIDEAGERIGGDTVQPGAAVIDGGGTGAEVDVGDPGTSRTAPTMMAS